MTTKSRIYDLVMARQFVVDGMQRTAWDRVGFMIIDGEDISVKISMIPVGSWTGWLKAYPRKPREQQTGQAAPKVTQEQPLSVRDEIDDDIPF